MIFIMTESKCEPGMYVIVCMAKPFYLSKYVFILVISKNSEANCSYNTQLDFHFVADTQLLYCFIKIIILTMIRA